MSRSCRWPPRATATPRAIRASHDRPCARPRCARCRGRAPARLPGRRGRPRRPRAAAGPTAGPRPRPPGRGAHRRSTTEARSWLPVRISATPSHTSRIGLSSDWARCAALAGSRTVEARRTSSHRVGVAVSADVHTLARRTTWSHARRPRASENRARAARAAWVAGANRPSSSRATARARPAQGSASTTSVGQQAHPGVGLGRGEGGAVRSSRSGTPSQSCARQRATRCSSGASSSASMSAARSVPGADRRPRRAGRPVRSATCRRIGRVHAEVSRRTRRPRAAAGRRAGDAGRRRESVDVEKCVAPSNGQDVEGRGAPQELPVSRVDADEHLVLEIGRGVARPFGESRQGRADRARAEPPQLVVQQRQTRRPTRRYGG